MDRVNTPGWATYLRVSDEDKQSPERSFSMQRQKIDKALLNSSDVPFQREYRDLLSGTTTNRADYQQMISDAKDGLFSHLGLYRADRFGRNTVEGLQAASMLMGFGIKLRIASMPTLRPEDPDGYFMFLIQMGMAQREVDVLRQRTRDGTEAKVRAGGWPNNAPMGYVNMECQIKSGKYERWIEKDPEYNYVIREAWDLLLTGRYTLDQICEELNKQGYTRRSGKPWAWNTPKRGSRKTAQSNLQHMFHNPIYAGWVVSKRFGITFGEIRGRWEPTITTEEYEKGIDILRKNDHQKVRSVRRYYLLRNILWVKDKGTKLKMYGSTPSGRDQSYAYYVTHSKIEEKTARVPCGIVDDQVNNWLNGLSIEHDHVPIIRQVYTDELNKVSGKDITKKLEDLRHKASSLKLEEAHLARLLVTRKISEETYDGLNAEWREKLHNIELNIRDLEREASIYIDDLEAALYLMSHLSKIYPRLGDNEKTTLLRILVKRIIVNPEGEIINQELNSPFMYLKSIMDKHQISINNGSSWDQYRPQ